MTAVGVLALWVCIGLVWQFTAPAPTAPVVYVAQVHHDRPGGVCNLILLVACTLLVAALWPVVLLAEQRR
jgi:hypothetical protein